jgi:hypothetical protein
MEMSDQLQAPAALATGEEPGHPFNRSGPQNQSSPLKTINTLTLRNSLVKESQMFVKMSQTRPLLSE